MFSRARVRAWRLLLLFFIFFSSSVYLSFPSPRTRRRTRTPRSLSLRTDENDVHGDLNNTHTRRRRRTEAAQDQEALPGGHDRAGAARDARALDVGVAQRQGTDGGHAVPVRESRAPVVAEEGQGEPRATWGLRGLGWGRNDDVDDDFFFFFSPRKVVFSFGFASCRVLRFLVWTAIVQYICILFFMLHRERCSRGSGASSRW